MKKESETPEPMEVTPNLTASARFGIIFSIDETRHYYSVQQLNSDRFYFEVTHGGAIFLCHKKLINKGFNIQERLFEVHPKAIYHFVLRNLPVSDNSKHYYQIVRMMPGPKSELSLLDKYSPAMPASWNIFHNYPRKAEDGTYIYVRYPVQLSEEQIQGLKAQGNLYDTSNLFPGCWIMIYLQEIGYTVPRFPVVYDNKEDCNEAANRCNSFNGFSQVEINVMIYRSINDSISG